MPFAVRGVDFPARLVGGDGRGDGVEESSVGEGSQVLTSPSCLCRSTLPGTERTLVSHRVFSTIILSPSSRKVGISTVEQCCFWYRESFLRTQKLDPSISFEPSIPAMYYDLNVPWTSRDADLQRKISFLADCTYLLLVINKHWRKLMSSK